VPTDRLVDRAAAGQAALAEREVLAADLARRERAHQRRVRERRARHDHQAGGVLVEAVHDAGARHARKRGVERKQRVLQRALAVARAGMHDETGRLVDDEDGRIAVHDTEGHAGLARGHAIVGDELGAHAQPLARHHPPPPQRRALAVRLHPALVDPALQPRARVLRQQPRQGYIEPLADESVGDGEFVKFGRLRGHGAIMTG
jgi:hypothetical protein